MNADDGSGLHPALAPYLAGDRRHDRCYPDLQDHIIALARAGRLVVVDEPINKDTEMHPLVRWQYRGGIPEPQRKAFLFTQPTDSKGNRYEPAVLIAGLAGNREIYCMGFGKPLDEIGPAWVKAMAAPIKPRIVENAPCQEIVTLGDELDAKGRGLDGVPVPISSPGWDNAPYLSAGLYITKDPDNGVHNVGIYRGQIKAPRRLGMNASLDFRPGIYLHWQKHKARGEKLPTCVAVGCPPILCYAAAYKVPEELDEFEVAGALVGGPINLTRAKTVDVLVPAEAEIVIEGYIDTEFLEPEGPFGESHGHVNLQEYNAFMQVTAITRRRHPVLTSIISQVTPSESSTIRRASMEPAFLHQLRSVLGIRGVQRVFMHEPLTAVLAVIVIQLKKGTPETEVWRALYGTANLHRSAGRWVIAVNEDIEPENFDAVLWAMSYRCQAQHDVKILDRKDPGHAPRGPRDCGESASVLVNAMLKGRYAPVALPKREFMENAKAIWERLGLPPLKPEAPWHGYDLGYWPAELERQAQLAVRGEYFALGEELARKRRSDVIMNTPISHEPDT